jgi:serine/threonine protein kinase
VQANVDGPVTLKIADFGNAKHFAQTVAMSAVGTFQWMAPEVASCGRVAKRRPAVGWQSHGWPAGNQDVDVRQSL